MGKVEVWESLPTFELYPGRTFFGLDKNKSHCFTLPKKMTDHVIRFFGLREGKLQIEIEFMINGRTYPAMVRWARMDRRRPNKLDKHDLPKRDTIQFQWKGQDATIFSMRVAFQDAFTDVEINSKQSRVTAVFNHLRDNIFVVLKL